MIEINELIYGVIVYVSNNGKVLMLRKKVRENDPNSGMYALPGGKLEGNEKETAEGRLERGVLEVKQETGITILDPIIRGAILFDNKNREFNNWKNHSNYFAYIFSADRHIGHLKESDEGIPLWIPKREIKDLSQNAGDVKIYEWLNDGRFFKGVIKHKGKELNESGTSVKYYGV